MQTRGWGGFGWSEGNFSTDWKDMTASGNETKRVDAASAISRRRLPEHTVLAHKIAHIRDLGNGSLRITPSRTGFDRFDVDSAFAKRHQPVLGGFVVLRRDGSLTYANADVFE